jgi:hypothetical protein
MRNPFRRWLPWGRGGRGTRILVIDDFVPDPAIGAGMPRAAELLRALSATGAAITFWPVSKQLGDLSAGAGSAFPGTAIVHEEGGLAPFLLQRPGLFDAIIVSRPHNMATFRQLLATHPHMATAATIVYDAEALFAEREILQRVVLGSPMAESEVKLRIDQELALASDADVVLTVNSKTAQAFTGTGRSDVRLLRHAVETRPTPAAFEARDGFLFVGPTYAEDTPNTDSVVWFVDHVLPRLRQGLGRNVSFTLAGANRAPNIAARQGAGVVMPGIVPDLTEVYSRARVFVAPTRFASGIPLKVYEAAAYGLPVVLTPLLAGQMGWAHEREVLVAETPEEFSAACLRLHQDRDLWNRIRSKALARVAVDCSPRRFDRIVDDLVADIAAGRCGQQRIGRTRMPGMSA